MRSIIAMIALLLLAACGQAGTYYERPPAEVREALRHSDFLISIFGNDASEVLVSQSGPDTIVWTIIDTDDRARLRLVAKVAPEKDGSRVMVDVQPPGGELHNRVEKGILAHPQIRKFYMAAVAEHVDATLQDRPFDLTRIYPDMMAAALASIPMMMDQARDAEKDSRKQMQDLADRIRENDPSLGSPNAWTGRKYGAPMDDAAPRDPEAGRP